jgi:hypothetical protein
VLATLVATATVLAAHPSKGLAHSQILVDSARPGVLAVGYGQAYFSDLGSAPLLLENLIASAPVREQIARRAGLPAGELGVIALDSTVLATVQPPPTEPVLVQLAGRPTIPMLDLEASAPTEAQAVRVANATYAAIKSYLDGPGRSSAFKLRVTRLGAPVGSSVSGQSLLVPLLAFLATIVICALVADVAVRLRPRALPAAPSL